MLHQREFYIPVAGGSVFVADWRPEDGGSGDPVLLIHDSLGCVGLWRDFPSVLATRLGRRVVAYDRLGFGRSSAREGLPSSNFVCEEAETIVRVLDHLEIARAVLFGYSVGGSMALCAAASAPDRVSAVVSESAQAFVEPLTLKGVEKARSTFSDPLQVNRLRRWHGDKAEWILRAWFDLWLSPVMAGYSLAPILPRVRCPVLAIHGDRDDFGSVAFPRLIAGMAGGRSSMLILEDCAHMPHRERLEEVLAAVEGFLAGL